MYKHLLFSLALITLSVEYTLACSCISPSSFCESITYEGNVRADIILRGKVINTTSDGKKIKVEQLLLGEMNGSIIVIQHGFCDLFFNELEDGSEYIIALSKDQDQERYFLIGCAISFLKIENEIIKGKIAPGINRLDYDEIFVLKNCGLNFSAVAISRNLQIYPNPTQDFLRIQNLSDEHAYDNLEVHLFDAVGRNISIHNHDGALPATEEWLIDIRDFSPGIYVVQISSAFQKVSHKLVKM